MPKINKICAACSLPMETRNRYCSSTCRTEGLAARIAVINTTISFCEFCKEPNPPTNGFALRRFCSDVCRIAASTSDEGEESSKCRTCGNILEGRRDKGFCGKHCYNHHPDVIAAERVWRHRNRDKINERRRERRLDPAVRSKEVEQDKIARAKRELDPQYKARRKALQRANKLRVQFDLSQEAYDRLYAEQSGKCAICKRGEMNDALKHILAVDHEHGTKNVRGLLCGQCNSAIGLLQDNPHIIQAAANYLLSYNAKKLAGA